MRYYYLSYKKLKDFITQSGVFKLNATIEKIHLESLLDIKNRWDLDRKIKNENKNNKKTELPVVDFDTGRRIIEIIINKRAANIKKILSSLEPDNNEKVVLPAGEEGDAQYGEIQVDTRSEESLITEEEHNPVHKFVSVYVDDVRFMQDRGNTDDPKPYEARYIRIEPPSGNQGAVILPLDLEREQVLLVTQYRHPQRGFLTEAPRGFGSMGQELSRETAKRELREETGYRPIETPKGERIIKMAELYQDSGKLVESPGYFLALVDRNHRDHDLFENRPVMEDPAWFNIGDFYKAIYQPGVNDYIEVELCDFALKSSRRDYLRGQTPVDSGILNICDAFTTNVALLAFPYIAQLLREKNGSSEPIFTEPDGTKTYFDLENFLPPIYPV